MAVFIAFIVIVVFFWLLFVTFAAVFTMIRSGQLTREVRVLKEEVVRMKTAGVQEPEPAKPMHEPDFAAAAAMKETEYVVGKQQIPETQQDIVKATKDAVIAHSKTNTVSVDTNIRLEEADSRTISAVMSFLRGGNIWVTAGVILLVLGLTFAYIYVDMVYHIPPEFKITAGFGLGVAVFAVGWRQRIKRRIFGMVMQGGGIGIMYLSLFASVKIFNILPFAVVFVLMTLLIALSVVISVYQSSQILALFSVVIGYCVPLLLSSGSGNYVVLFSYYMLINISVFVISLKKYWRYLNSVAFLFTLGVGLMWGSGKYENAFFFNIEIFLIGFFLIFTAINISASLKQPAKTIENIYAVSTSFAYITIQMVLVRHFEYGQALASGTLGLFYILLCFLLVRFTKDRLRNLVTLYLSLGIIFANLAVPFALKGNWTAGIWAIEGAVLVILGVYQRNRFFRCFGSILIIAGSYFAWAEYMYFDNRYFLNSVWIIRFFAAVSMLISAAAYHRLNDWTGRVLSRLSLAAGLVLWYTAFGMEAFRLCEEYYGLRYSMLLFFIVSASAFIFNYAANRVKWSSVRWVSLTPALYAAYMMLVHGHILSLYYMGSIGSHLIYMNGLYMSLAGYMGWPLFFIVSIWFLYMYTVRDAACGKFAAIAHGFLYFTLVMFISANLSYLIVNTLMTAKYMQLSVYLLVPVAALWITTVKNVFNRFRFTNAGLMGYRLYVPMAIIVYLLYAVLRTSAMPMPSAPLSLPFINMLDLLIIAVSAGIIYWLLYFKYKERGALSGSTINLFLGVTAAVIFIWMHCALGRGVSEVLNVQYYFGSLFNSDAYQLVISVFWGITGFCTMMFGKKVARRAPWIAGAVLLAFDSVKLIFIDMSNVGTLPRIGSFMAVGLIFIVIGYFVPLPPKREEIKGVEDAENS